MYRRTEGREVYNPRSFKPEDIKAALRKAKEFNRSDPFAPARAATAMRLGLLRPSDIIKGGVDY